VAQLTVRRRLLTAPLALALVASAALLGGCGNAGLVLARQACTHVGKSITLYERSLKNPDATAAAAQQSQALEQLRIALPLAAQANSADGSWDALMTAISESSRVNERLLIVSLRATCANARTGTPGLSITVPT